ncbi:hypothetical protein WOLCODRAFT_19310 [Wolfiporia cocos MD-104 SS10]|uniref:Uncharacterized protein n=1 Tax=Wolfiporia cocos (strain MD-104) TaxID=742152 RepID=A0A2H3K9B6_WOLCO|nr:hypothetical protein WOLCODRAFT_19310 [Wolfiporia cocos MD-104 SS10]
MSASIRATTSSGAPRLILTATWSVVRFSGTPYVISMGWKGPIALGYTAPRYPGIGEGARDPLGAKGSSTSASSSKMLTGERDSRAGLAAGAAVAAADVDAWA